MAGTFTKLLYHVVFSTKDRETLIGADLRPELYKYIGGIIRGERGTLLEIGGMADHIHVVARFRADVSVAEMARLIKCNSSKWANERPDRRFRFEWQSGYGAFTVSESQLESVRHYVQGQEDHHQKRTFKEEFVAMLTKHGIAYEERHLWD